MTVPCVVRIIYLARTTKRRWPRTVWWHCTDDLSWLGRKQNFLQRRHFYQIILRYFGKTANLTVFATRNSKLTWPYITYSDRIIGEKVFGKVAEGGGLGTISFIIPAITRKEWAESRKFQSGHLVSEPRFELKSSRIGRRIIRTRPASEYTHDMHYAENTTLPFHTVWPQHIFVYQKHQN